MLIIVELAGLGLASAAAFLNRLLLDLRWVLLRVIGQATSFQSLIEIYCKLLL